MIDLGAFNSNVERTLSSKEEQDRVFARHRERMKRILAELEAEEKLRHQKTIEESQ